MDERRGIIEAFVPRIAQRLLGQTKRGFEARHLVNRLADTRNGQVDQAISTVQIPEQRLHEQLEPGRETVDRRPLLGQRRRIGKLGAHRLDQVARGKAKPRRRQLTVLQRGRKRGGAKIQRLRGEAGEIDDRPHIQRCVRMIGNGRYRFQARGFEGGNDPLEIGQAIVHLEPDRRAAQGQRVRGGPVQARADCDPHRACAHKRGLEIEQQALAIGPRLQVERDIRPRTRAELIHHLERQDTDALHEACNGLDCAAVPHQPVGGVDRAAGNPNRDATIRDLGDHPCAGRRVLVGVLGRVGGEGLAHPCIVNAIGRPGPIQHVKPLDSGKLSAALKQDLAARGHAARPKHQTQAVLACPSHNAAPENIAVRVLDGEFLADVAAGRGGIEPVVENLRRAQVDIEAEGRQNRIGGIFPSDHEGWLVLIVKELQPGRGCHFARIVKEDMRDLIGLSLVEIAIPFDIVDELVGITRKGDRRIGTVLNIHRSDHTDGQRIAIGVLQPQARGLAHFGRSALQRDILVLRQCDRRHARLHRLGHVQFHIRRRCDVGHGNAEKLREFLQVQRDRGVEGLGQAQFDDHAQAVEFRDRCGLLPDQPHGQGRFFRQGRGDDRVQLRDRGGRNIGQHVADRVELLIEADQIRKALADDGDILIEDRHTRGRGLSRQQRLERDVDGSREIGCLGPKLDRGQAIQTTEPKVRERGGRIVDTGLHRRAIPRGDHGRQLRPHGQLDFFVQRVQRGNRAIGAEHRIEAAEIELRQTGRGEGAHQRRIVDARCLQRGRRRGQRGLQIALGKRCKRRDICD